MPLVVIDRTKVVDTDGSQAIVGWHTVSSLADGQNTRLQDCRRAFETVVDFFEGSTVKNVSSNALRLSQPGQRIAVAVGQLAVHAAKYMDHVLNNLQFSSDKRRARMDFDYAALVVGKIRKQRRITDTRALFACPRVFCQDLDLQRKNAVALVDYKLSS